MLMLPIIGNPHFVCLNCRRSVKVFAPYIWNGDGNRPRQIMLTEKVVCSECHGELICVGKKFTTPRKRDDIAWKKLEWMIQNGWRGYGWPTQPKMNLREVQEAFVVTTQAQTAAAKGKEDATLLERRRAAKSSFSKTGQKRLKAELKRQRKYQDQVLADVQLQESSSKSNAEAKQ